MFQGIAAKGFVLSSFRFAAVLSNKSINLLVNGRIQKHRQDSRCGTINGHGHRGSWTGQVEAIIEGFHVL